MFIVRVFYVKEIFLRPINDTFWKHAIVVLLVMGLIAVALKF